MGILANIAVGKRLLLAMLLPIFGMLCFATISVMDARSVTKEMARLGLMVDAVNRIANLIDVVQIERGRSAAFLGSKGKQGGDELAAARGKSDALIATYDELIHAVDAVGDAALADVAQQLKPAFASLPGHRKAVDDLSVDRPKNIAFYSNIIAMALQAGAKASAATSEGAIATAVDALGNLSQAKEFAGQERAFVAGALGVGTVTPTDAQSLAKLIARQEQLLKIFVDKQSAERQKAYAAQLTAIADAKFLAARQAVLDAGAGSVAPSTTGAEWFALASERIAAMRGLEIEAVKTLAQDAGHLAEAARRNLLITASAALAFLGLTLFLAIALGRSITKPLSILGGDMQRLADGDLSIAIEGVARRDELGAMARMVQIFRDNGAAKLSLEREAAETRVASESERMARQQREAEEARRLKSAVDALGDGLNRLAEGDVTYRIRDPFAAHLDQLRHDFNNSVAKLFETLTVVGSNARTIRSGSEDIRTAAANLSRRTEQQAAALEETSAALSEIAKSVAETAQSAQRTNRTMATMRADAERSGEIVLNAVKAMGQIEDSSKQISRIIGVIDEIAFQTNLLALNAGVEAARAGEAGRGFAVVATEVRALAQRSADAAKEIKGLISAGAAQVEDGVKLVSETGDALTRIVASFGEIGHLIAEMAHASQVQASGIADINAAIAQMDQATQQNAAMGEEATAATAALSMETDSMAALIAKFKTSSAASEIAFAMDVRSQQARVAAYAV